MEPAEEPRCTNQMVVREFGSPEPTQVCSCAAGLIHMHDCPVSLGLPCLHFDEGSSEALEREQVERSRGRLMDDYLTRTYFHRVRSLAPAGDPILRRREELYAFYATVELDEAELAGQGDEEYERERERLIDLRKKREEARAQREERTREERARERARLGIKTVVEKAREAVENQGNIASSVVDDIKLPDSKPRRRRRRRKPGGERAPAAGAGHAPQNKDASPGGEKPKRRRRRRRRRGGGGGGGGGGAAPA